MTGEVRMNIKIQKIRAIEYVILFFALFCMLLVGPVGVLDKSREVAVNETVAGMTQPAGANQRLQQVFLADGGYLEKLSIYAQNDFYRKVFHLTIYDELGEILFSRDVAVEDDEIHGYLTVPVEIQTVAGRAYVWEISHAEVELVLGWQNTADAGIGGLGNYYYVNENSEIQEQVGKNILMRLTYADPVSTLGKAGMIVGIAAVAAIIVLLVENFARKKNRSKQVTVQWILQWICNPLILAGTAAGLILVYTGFYGGIKTDHMVYTAGILILAGMLAYMVNAKRRPEDSCSRADLKALLEDKGMDWLQSVFWAGAIWGCIDYVNALYNIYQDHAYRKTLICFGLALIVMCGKKAVFRLYNLIWIAAASVAGFIYCRGFQENAEQAKLAERNAVLFVVIGLVAIQLFRILRNRKVNWKKLAVPYCILMLLLFVLIIVFRNTRGWPINLAISFTLFYIFYLAWEKRGRFLGIFCNGIILNFVCALIFAVLRRPYRAWYFQRYNFIFHTVTVTATYLTLVLCALFIKFLMQYHKSRKMYVWGTSGMLFGIAASLLLMTLSRTGYLAVIAMVFVVLIYVSIVCYRDNWKIFLAKTGTLVLLVLSCLSVTYSAVLLIPPLYDDPYRFDLEEGEEAWALYKGDPSDSMKYMTVRRFVYCFDTKLFGDEHFILREFVDDYMSDASETDDVKLQQDKMLLAENVALADVSQLIASAGETAGAADGSGNAGPGDGEADFSNGRLEIFKSYIPHWNLTGHDEMGVELPDGSLGVHAHNTYLQVIHDHGLITGIVFLLVGVVSMVQIFRYAWINLRKNSDKSDADPYAALPLAILFHLLWQGWWNGCSIRAILLVLRPWLFLLRF